MLLPKLLADSLSGDAVPAIEIFGLAADSREVRPGFLFAALRGKKTDGGAFVKAAVSAGAVAILTGVDTKLPNLPVPVVRAGDPRRALSLAAARLHPRQPRHLVAVTGTSGKTSVSVFVRQIFEAAGHPAASLGTIGLVAPGRAEPGGLTTPDPIRLHRTLDALATSGIDHAAIEASSHGLDQRRLDGLRLVAAGFTNLGRDHLDYHSDVEDYLRAKLLLFSDLLPSEGAAAISADSEVAPRVIAAVRPGARVITVGAAGRDIRILSSEPEGLSQRLALDAFGYRARVMLPLAGTFQAANAVMAAGLAIAAGIEAKTAINALSLLKGAPGRLDKVGETADGAAVFVDYAHKPEAIRAALTALRPMTKGRLIVVFGAGGDRDAGKRPLMGAAAAETADLVIVTDDNPRTEDPGPIRRAILSGAPGAIEIAGRGRAIEEAVAMLRSGDILCIAGKGHETGQTIGDTIIPFSDHEVAAKALRKMRA